MAATNATMDGAHHQKENGNTARFYGIDEPAVAAMSSEERARLVRQYTATQFGMILSGCGVFAGVAGGLWSSIGGGAIGVAFGCASGLLCGSLHPYFLKQKVLCIDEQVKNKQDAVASNNVAGGTEGEETTMAV